ncbi:MAG: response regulator transcription factor [Actinobacteria bacterium]|nr:response regulator transcription factor [Actinomycetota bacterium]
MGEGSIRVVVADDHEPFRRALVHLLSLEGDFDVVGQAANGREACEMVADLTPDLAFLDLVMPELDGAAAAHEIRKRCPETKIIILSVFNQESMIRRGLEAGADRYLTKGISRQELIAAAKAVAAEPHHRDTQRHEHSSATGIFG